MSWFDKIIPRNVSGGVQLHSLPVTEIHPKDNDEAFEVKPRQAGMTLAGASTWGIWENAPGTRAVLADLGIGAGMGANHNQVSGTARLGYEQIFGENLFEGGDNAAFGVRLGYTLARTGIVDQNNFELTGQEPSEVAHYLTAMGEFVWYQDQDTGVSTGFGIHIPVSGPRAGDFVPFASISLRQGILGNSFLPPPKKDTTAALSARTRLLEQWQNMVAVLNSSFFNGRREDIVNETVALQLEGRFTSDPSRSVALVDAAKAAVVVYQDSASLKKKKAAFDAAFAILVKALNQENGSSSSQKVDLAAVRADVEKEGLLIKLNVVEDYLKWLTTEEKWSDVGFVSYAKTVEQLEADLKTMREEGSDQTKREAEDIGRMLKKFKAVLAKRLANEVTGEKLGVYKALLDRAEKINDLFFKGEEAKKGIPEALDRFEELLQKYVAVHKVLVTLLEGEQLPQFNQTARLASYLLTQGEDDKIADVKEKYTIPAMRKALGLVEEPKQKGVEAPAVQEGEDKKPAVKDGEAEAPAAPK